MDLSPPSHDTKIIRQLLHSQGTMYHIGVRGSERKDTPCFKEVWCSEEVEVKDMALDGLPMVQKLSQKDCLLTRGDSNRCFRCLN